MVRLDMSGLMENLTSTTCFVWPKTGQSRDRTAEWRTVCVYVSLMLRGHTVRLLCLNSTANVGTHLPFSLKLG